MLLGQFFNQFFNVDPHILRTNFPAVSYLSISKNLVSFGSFLPEICLKNRWRVIPTLPLLKGRVKEWHSFRKSYFWMGVLDRGALIREWAVIRSFTVSDSVLLGSLQLTHGLTYEWLPLLGSILSVLFDGVLVILTDDRESVACHVGTLLLTRRHLL